MLTVCCLQSSRCCYVILIMSVYWATEVIPMSVTALIPIAAMPWLGIASSREICPNYFDVRTTYIGLSHPHTHTPFQDEPFRFLPVVPEVV